MPYIIRYSSTTQNKSCIIMLRGVFEDGKYWGYIHVRDKDTTNPCDNFNFGVSGVFNGFAAKIIFDSISSFKKIQQAESTDRADCVVGNWPVGKQDIFFKHFVGRNYDESFRMRYEKFISILNTEFDRIIRSQIAAKRNVSETNGTVESGNEE